jgi:hypothetical protein
MAPEFPQIPGFDEDRYRVLLFEQANDVDEGAVIEFWSAEDAMPAATAQERVGEVIAVAQVQGELVGVSTAYLSWSGQLRTPMWHYRTFVGAAHRRSMVAVALLRQTRFHLESQFEEGSDTRAPGIMVEVENVGLKTARMEAVWKTDWAGPIRWTFIGENARGDHVRVYYFPGALAPLPG